MKFNKIFFKSGDFITAIDVFPLNRSQICCANYSGRIFLIDYESKLQVVENRLKLQRRKSSTSDTEVIEIPHVSSIAFSPDGNHLFCGLETGLVIALDPNVLVELRSFSLTKDPISGIRFSPDSSFVTVFVSFELQTSKKFHEIWFFFSFFCTLGRMKSRPLSWCIATKNLQRKIGPSWADFVTIQNQFVMFCSFHLHHHRRFTKFFRDWFPWHKTE